jgi:hypothetical protein
MEVDPSHLVDAAAVNDFVPIDPVAADLVTYRDPRNGKEVTRAWATLAPTEILALLPNQRAQITTSKVDTSGDVKYLTGSLAAEAGAYRVIMDYAKFTSYDLIDPQSKANIGAGRVGVGLRVKAEVLTRKANIDLGSLIALGVAAKLGQVQGTLDVQVMGMNSPDITMLFPTPSQIDETSIQRALEALAAIKSKIGDKATTLSPQLLAWRPKDMAALTVASVRLQ